MSPNKNAVILFGLCSALAACDHSNPVEPEAVTSQASASATQGMNLLAAGNTWATMRALSPNRWASAAGAINGIVYVVGGWGADGGTFTRVDAYRVATNTWARVASLPAARADLNGASPINGKLYVTGGTNRDGIKTKTLYVYDPATNSWSRKADMPRPSCGGDQGVISGQLYVYTACLAMNTMGEVFFRYNPATNTWVKRAAPPVDHSYGAGAAVGGKFYLTGGYTCCDGNTHNLDVYNPATNSWTVRPGKGSTSITAAVLNEKLYILGGYGDTYNSAVNAYDPVTNRWTSKAPMPSGSALGSAAASNGKLYHIEGQSMTIPWTTLPSKVYAYTP
jgi:N-acetylneuraminic acid mutarotase